LTFAAAFLKYLAKIPLDARYRSFELFLVRLRRVKVCKNVTNRIVTKEYVGRMIDHIHRAECRGIICRSRAEQYRVPLHYITRSAYDWFTCRRSSL